MQEKSFINRFGYSEKHASKEITMELSGHLNRNSPYATSDGCGNCDGGRCGSCHKIYRVIAYDEPIFNELGGYTEIKIHASRIFDSLEEALEFYSKL